MNILKRIALGTAAMAFVAAPVTVASAQAGHGSWQKNWGQKKQCRIIDKQQQFLIDRFDFHNKWHLNRFQQLVNRENRLNCATNITSYDYLKRFGNFESLVAALEYTNLDDALNSPGKFTVFAPTDNAFAKLPPALVQGLLTDPAQKPALENILKYHVIAGAAVPSSTAVTLTEATMLNGEKVQIKVQNGKLFLNDSQVVIKDVKTSNGVIHVIDTVLVPSN